MGLLTKMIRTLFAEMAEVIRRAVFDSEESRGRELYSAKDEEK